MEIYQKKKWEPFGGAWYLDGGIAEPVKAEFFHSPREAERVGGHGALLLEQRSAVLALGVDAGLLHFGQVLEGEVPALEDETLVLRIGDGLLDEEADVVPGEGLEPRGHPALQHHQSGGLQDAGLLVVLFIDDVYAQHVGPARIGPFFPAGHRAVLP